MVNTANSAFNKTPEPFDGIGMRFSDNINLGTMVNAIVNISALHVLDSVVPIQFIGEYCGRRKDVLAHHSEQSRAFHVVGNQSFNSPVALNHSNHGSFNLVSDHWATRLSFAPSSHVGFIHFDGLSFSAKWV